MESKHSLNSMLQEPSKHFTAHQNNDSEREIQPLKHTVHRERDLPHWVPVAGAVLCLRCAAGSKTACPGAER